jgi:hypothetical protein
MTAIKRKLPRDPNQRAKSIVDIVAALSEGEDPETLSDPTAINWHDGDQFSERDRGLLVWHNSHHDEAESHDSQRGR